MLIKKIRSLHFIFETKIKNETFLSGNCVEERVMR